MSKTFAHRLARPALQGAGLAAFIALTLAAAPAVQAAEPSDASLPTAVIVRVPKPWYAPRALVASRMRDTIPQYADLPGLSFKAYSFERASGDYGGVYLWQSRKAAQAWFNAAWFERVKRERGADAQVRSFSAHLVLDNVAGGTPASTDSDSIATLVEIAVPPNTPQERLVAGLRASVPTYQAIPGLLRKYYITSDQGTFGGIYLWKDEASARAWFNPQWHERVTQTYGRPAVIEWFDTPILTPTTNRGNAVPEAFVVGAP